LACPPVGDLDQTCHLTAHDARARPSRRVDERLHRADGTAALPAVTELTPYRILQEAMINIGAHNQ
jgi:hypothetical protein